MVVQHAVIEQQQAAIGIATGIMEVGRTLRDCCGQLLQGCRTPGRRTSLQPAQDDAVSTGKTVGHAIHQEVARWPTAKVSGCSAHISSRATQKEHANADGRGPGKNCRNVVRCVL